jgi:hypothetical protein
MVVLFFGGIGTYYFKVFRWRHLEDPKYDLLVVKKTDNSELAFFRKKTVPEFIDPARLQLESLIKLRKATEKGTVRPDDYDQTMKEIGNRLLEIMNGAKLRQIPTVYEKKYIEVLVGISEVYRGWRDLEEVMSTDIPQEKTRFLKSSIDHTKKAEKLLKIQRQNFYVK